MFVKHTIFLTATLFLFGSAAAQIPSAAPASQPVVNTLSNLPTQKIGANDLIAVSVYDAPELTRTIRVTNEGQIRMPLVKHSIKALGLLPAELETSIADALKSEQLLIDPVVTVTIVEYNSHPISVAGAVKTPTTFQATTPVTLLEAITRAGGLSAEAGPEILVTRNQKGPDDEKGTSLTQRIPVKGLIDAADPELNIKLSGGEEVRVPENGKIYVVGSVKKPGAFPVQDLSGATVMQMLALAEGTQGVFSDQAYIYRREGSGSKNEIAIQLKKIMERKSPDVPLMANDILYVPEDKGRKMRLATLEKILMFAGTGGATALAYTTIR